MQRWGSSRRRLAIAVVFALATTGAIAASAVTSAGAVEAGFTLSPSSGVPGTTTTASDAGSHCIAGDTVNVTAPFGVSATTTADANGNWSVPVVIPIDARTAGSSPISASFPGNATGYASQTFGITPS